MPGSFMTAIRFKSQEMYWYALFIFILLALRSFLTADIGIAFYQSKGVDEGLYVERALGILETFDLGPYAGNWGVFGKLPGFSIILAGARAIKLPYDVLIKILEFGAYLLLVGALVRQKVGYAAIILSLLLLTASPFYYAFDYFRIVREPMTTAIFISIAALFLVILSQASRGYINAFSLILVSVFIVVGQLLREEAYLLYYVLPVLLAGGTFVLLKQRLVPRRVLIGVPLLVMVVPTTMIQLSNQAVRYWISKTYGVNILNEYNEGELPRLIAAMNRVEEGQERNLRVVVSQRQLNLLSTATPSLTALIARMRADYAIGPGSLSCDVYRVCDEITSTHFQFFLRLAAWRMGKTDTAHAAQQYFRELRLEIERTCAEGRLTCADHPDNHLMARPSIRVLEQSAKGLVQVVSRLVQSVPPPLVDIPLLVGWYEGARQLEAVVRPGGIDYLAELYSDAHWQGRADFRDALLYYVRYPDVAASDNYGPNGLAGLGGAHVHYQEIGRSQGRIWGASREKPVLAKFEQRVKNLRAPAWDISRRVSHYALPLGAILIFAVVTAEFWRRRWSVTGVWTAIISAFLALQLAALGYVVVFFVEVDDRLLMPIHQMLIILGPIAAVQVIRLVAAAYKPRNTNA
jgi:hypothetical protein